MIRGNYETSSNVIGKSTSKRDVSNKFGHFIHPNITENMNDTNVYGVSWPLKICVLNKTYLFCFNF